MIVTVGLVGLPQFLAQAKEEGRLDFFLTLPISREAYLLSQVSFVLLQVLPGIAFALALGAWHYDFTLDIHPAIVIVIPLAVLSLAGLGAAVAILSPHLQLTNAITQLVIFYVLFFAPVIIPEEQLPDFLVTIAKFLPPTYVADAIRASVTDLPGTDLWRSIGMMAIFGVASIGIAAIALRRRA
jgi:ABC-2 type transport system permease protein